MRQWAASAPTGDLTKNVATLERLVKQIEERGSLVYFYSLPYAEPLQSAPYTRATAAAAHAAFSDDRQWLQFEQPMPDLRWADGVHLDDRSAVIISHSIDSELSTHLKRR